MNRRIYTYPYSQAYDPAMPVIEVGVSLPKRNTAEITMPALLDSGSDGTLIPIDLLESIGAKPVGPARVHGLWGGSRAANMYLVKLYIGLTNCLRCMWPALLRTMSASLVVMSLII